MEERYSAAMKDAQIKFRKEECASGMERKYCAAMKDAPTAFSMEESVSGMERGTDNAATMDA